MTTKAAPISAERQALQVELFRQVALMRAFELSMLDHITKQGFEGFWHPGMGQEGLQAGAISAMGPDDYLFYSHRGVGYGIARGLPLVDLFGDLFCRTVGSTGGKGGGTPHYIDLDRGIMGESAVLGSSFVLGAGAALTAKMTKSGRVAVVFFGDGTASRGTFHEALLQSSVWKLPLVLICENNGFALSTTFASQSPTPNIADRAAGYGVPGIVVNGQSPLEVHDVVKDAINRARDGHGPSLIECKTQRFRGHYEGDPQKYREQMAEDSSDFEDPLEVLRASIPDALAASMEREAAAEVEQARQVALAAPRPDPGLIFEDVFSPAHQPTRVSTA